MKLPQFLATLTAAAAFSATSDFSLAAGENDKDRCLAPYFQLGSGGSSVEQFPLRHTETKVDIAGVIAEVTVIQTYANTGSETIEASYLFPASTRAAVHGMEMRIGDRHIVAKIQEREKAKATYESAKAQKKSAALLEQQRPNVFEMQVANILPGDEVEVTLHYSERLNADEGTYEFVYPTVVGPRYSNRTHSSPDAAQHAWVQNPYLAKAEAGADTEVVASPTGFQFGLSIKTGMPIQTLTCTSHRADFEFKAKDAASFSLSGSDAANRDVIVRYRLAGREIESGLMLHEGERENFFLLNVQPPARVRPEHIPPREYVFVVDVSGSMNGFPLDLAKDLFRDLIGGLREEDSFNILAFAGGSEVLSRKSLPATERNIAKGVSFIDNQRGGGGTELVKALKKALALSGSEDCSRSVLVITDGFISMEADAFEMVREKLGRANLFAFGIGSSVNRHLIEGLAHVGMGEPFVVTEVAEAKPVAKKLRDYIASPVLTNIRIEGDGIALRDTEPVSVPDVFAQRPLALTGKWKGKAKGTVRVSGKTGGGATFVQEFDVAEAAEGGTQNPALRALWARERVRALADYAQLTDDSETVKEVTNLGLTYSIMTPYTSFVAVDERVRDTGGDSKLVKQPLPLPKGVSNAAIKSGGGAWASGGSVPEPGAAAVLLISLLALVTLRNR